MRSRARVVAMLSAVTILAGVACQRPEGGGGGGGGDAAAGQAKYASTCSTCHGSQGDGVKGLGKALRGNPLVAGSSDQDLVKLIVEGRAANDPGNTTGIAMPPRGGNPGLTDADLADIVAFVRTLK